MLACPNQSFTNARSAPASSKCVAIECFKQWNFRFSTGRPVASPYCCIHIPPDLVVDRWAADGESGSHHDFRFRHDVWTMLFHQIGEGITSIISIAWYFTTQSGGICFFPVYCVFR